MPTNYSNKNGLVYPSGTTAARPTSVNNGFIYFNTTVGALQIYQNGSWYVLTNINAPLAPTSVVATNQGTERAYNNGQASIAFTPSNETAGFPASYTATSSPGSFTATGSSSPLTITGLQSATSYTYTVTASNNTGTSSASSASSAVTATTVPQAPTIGTATGADQSATLTFTAGATGGSSITNYKYSTDNTTYTAFNPAQTSSPLTISGLTNGQNYSFYLKAVNANGDSAASAASNSITPASTSFESIATVTVGSGGSSSISFTSIPATYSHLQLRFMARSSRNQNAGYGVISYNSDTSTNYSYHSLYGQGSSVSSDGAANVNYQTLIYLPGALRTANVFGVAVVDILDYANTNKYKTLRVLDGYDSNTAGELAFQSGSWRNNNAITSITITEYNGNNFQQYSHFALYGIKAAS